MEITAIDAYQTAIKLLSRREHSAHELTVKLLQKGFSESLIEEALTQLQKEKLQSDRRYLEMLMRTRQNQGYGPVKLAHELQSKGVSQLLIEEYFDPEAAVWYELASEARRKKFGNKFPKDYQAKAKQMRFLQYRGFSMAQINAALIE